MRMIIVFLGLFLALSVPIQAQTKIDSAGHAYIYASATRNGSISKNAYVQAVRNCDRKVLQINCEELVVAATSFIPGGYRYESLNALADYMDSLVEQDCRVSPVVMSRVRLGKAERWSRATRKGERCLYDNNLGLDILSLSCGNIIADANVPQRIVMTQVESPEPAPAPATAPTAIAAQVGVTAPPPAKVEVVVKIVPEQHDQPMKETSHWSRNKGKYITGTILGVAGALICNNNCRWVIKNDINNVNRN